MPALNISFSPGGLSIAYPEGSQPPQIAVANSPELSEGSVSRYWGWGGQQQLLANNAHWESELDQANARATTAEQKVTALSAQVSQLQSYSTTIASQLDQARKDSASKDQVLKAARNGKIEVLL